MTRGSLIIGSNEVAAAKSSRSNMRPVVELFALKCQLCCIVFNLEMNDAHLEAKEAKRETLLELIELMDGEK